MILEGWEMDKEELLRNCSPEFQQQVKEERVKMAEAKEEAAQLERERAATPDAFLQEIKGLRADIQALPDRILGTLSKALQREFRFLIWAFVAYAVIEWVSKYFWK